MVDAGRRSAFRRSSAANAGAAVARGVAISAVRQALRGAGGHAARAGLTQTATAISVHHARRAWLPAGPGPQVTSCRGLIAYARAARASRVAPAPFARGPAHGAGVQRAKAVVTRCGAALVIAAARAPANLADGAAADAPMTRERAAVLGNVALLAVRGAVREADAVTSLGLTAATAASTAGNARAAGRGARSGRHTIAGLAAVGAARSRLRACRAVGRARAGLAGRTPGCRVGRAALRGRGLGCARGIGGGAKVDRLLATRADGEERNRGAGDCNGTTHQSSASDARPPRSKPTGGTFSTRSWPTV